VRSQLNEFPGLQVWLRPWPADAIRQHEMLPGSLQTCQALGESPYAPYSTFGIPGYEFANRLCIAGSLPSLVQLEFDHWIWWDLVGDQKDPNLDLCAG